MIVSRFLVLAERQNRLNRLASFSTSSLVSTRIGDLLEQDHAICCIFGSFHCSYRPDAFAGRE